MQALYNKQITDEDIYVQITEEAFLNLPTISAECCIYEVPRHLCTANESVFTPLAVSIGPLHRHAGHLQRNHHHKINYLKSFGRDAQHLQTYRHIITNNLTKIRDSYANPSVRFMDSRELVMMVLVDAAFIIELFRRSHDPRLIEPNDPMFHRPWMVEKVFRDLRLLENQLPFFILQELYDAAYEEVPSFMEIVCEFLGMSHDRISRQDAVECNHKHFLDLLRANYLPIQLRDYRYWKLSLYDRAHRTPKETIMCKTATALLEAGVKFRVANDHECCLLDIEFDEHHGTLVIPRIDIEVDTESLFRNIAVYEQLHYYTDSYIIDYILFLDFLISTPADVALLVKRGIIVNWLGSDERVVELFNGLSRQLRLNTEAFFYTNQCRQLNAFYKKRWNRYYAVLKLKYFDHPWAVIAVGYAVVMLLLAMAQVISGFMSMR